MVMVLAGRPCNFIIAARFWLVGICGYLWVSLLIVFGPLPPALLV